MRTDFDHSLSTFRYGGTPGICDLGVRRNRLAAALERAGQANFAAFYFTNILEIKLGIGYNFIGAG
ncbi:hypothetical protein [Paenibacillus cymbidii]|uniref:hypothetical protein n=1 Tax=Paenibacillus cymbidii TaxID=1639034 RepID=UPI0010802385|nr:hypothetical protein [Paenibacillus cymbidii]